MLSMNGRCTKEHRSFRVRMTETTSHRTPTIGLEAEFKSDWMLLALWPAPKLVFSCNHHRVLQRFVLRNL